MKAEEIEKTLKEIREREDYLVKLKSGESINTSYYWSSAKGMSSSEHSIFELNKEEKEYLKSSCISEIKRLRKSIECLTE